MEKKINNYKYSRLEKCKECGIIYRHYYNKKKERLLELCESCYEEKSGSKYGQEHKIEIGYDYLNRPMREKGVVKYKPKSEVKLDNDDPLRPRSDLSVKIISVLKKHLVGILEPSNYVSHYIEFLAKFNIPLKGEKWVRESKKLYDDTIIDEILNAICQTERGKFLLKEKGLVSINETLESFYKSGLLKKDLPETIALKKFYGHFLPKNELGTLAIFLCYIDEWFLDLEDIKRDFPDLILRDKKGNLVKAELEYKSSSFIRHKHDPTKCDMVICWEHNSKLPVPVIELKSRKVIQPK